MFVLWRAFETFTNTASGAFLAQEKLTTLATLTRGGALFALTICCCAS